MQQTTVHEVLEESRLVHARSKQAFGVKNWHASSDVTLSSRKAYALARSLSRSHKTRMGCLNYDWLKIRQELLGGCCILAWGGVG